MITTYTCLRVVTGSRLRFLASINGVPFGTSEERDGVHLDEMTSGYQMEKPGSARLTSHAGFLHTHGDHGAYLPSGDHCTTALLRKCLTSDVPHRTSCRAHETRCLCQTLMHASSLSPSSPAIKAIVSTSETFASQGESHGQAS